MLYSVRVTNKRMKKKEFTDIEDLIPILEKLRTRFSHRKSGVMVGISGIDGSGKGYVAEKARLALLEKGYTVHLEHLDHWLDLPNVRFSEVNSAETFYQHAFRFDDLVQNVLEPYKSGASIRGEMDYLEETWNSFRKRFLNIQPVDFFILEGIFLFQDRLNSYLDLKIWIDCSFDTALKRAIHRNQEGLDPESIAEAYRARFFPAQHIHFAKDKPRESSDIIFRNEGFP